jgi:hypothetical protein
MARMPTGADLGAVSVVDDTSPAPSPPVKPLDTGDVGKVQRATWALFREANFYVLFVVLMCGIGTGVCVVNNIAELVISRDDLKEVCTKCMRAQSRQGENERKKESKRERDK